MAGVAAHSKVDHRIFIIHYLAAVPSSVSSLVFFQVIEWTLTDGTDWDHLEVSRAPAFQITPILYRTNK